MKNKKCIACKANQVDLVLNLGLQPPSNRYIKNYDEVIDRHALLLGQCNNCGHLQLIDPMPVEMVSPRVDWIHYNEPEGHLDDVVEMFTKLPGLNRMSHIKGLTYKEDTTIGRLNKLGYKNLFRYDAEEHFGLAKKSGLECIQQAITCVRTESLASKFGQADLIFIRHILEHAHNLIEFTQAIKNLVVKDGYIVFEVPDSQKLLSKKDYPFIWEEHISYFTESSLEKFLINQGLEIIELMRYPYTFEDSLVVIARLSNQKLSDFDVNIDNQELVNEFSSSFQSSKKSIRELLAKYKNKKVALFGGGHLAAKFLNIFELSEYVDFVLDDHPDKQGLFMPGCKVPIVSSVRLEDTDLCLLSLSPESEQKILTKFSWYLEGKGEFKSIFSASPISIFNN